MPILREPSKDQRSRDRITKVLPVDCTLISLPLNRTSPHYLSAGDIFGGRTVNFSTSGLQVHSDIEFDPMTVLDVAVRTGRTTRTVTVRTQVAWSKRNAFDIYGRWRMGMRIIEALPADLEALHECFKQPS